MSTPTLVRSPREAKEHPAAPRPDAAGTRTTKVGPQSGQADHPAPARRNAALDALRGLAALVVVVHHTLLLSPAGQASTYPGVLNPILHTPLHVVVDGTAAVWMFFVLSGIVVMLPVSRWRRRDWASYLPRRLVRLYLPAAASVPLALGLWWLTFQHGVVGESRWSASHHDIDVTDSVIKSFTLLNGTTSLNSPLWSLRWELIFSLIFPALALAVIALRRAWPLVLMGAFTLSWWGFTQPFASQWIGAARYLPLFVVGMVIADRLPTWRPTLARVPRLAWGVVAVAGVSLMSVPAMSGQLPRQVDTPEAYGVLGAGICVFVVAAAPLPRRLVEHPSLGWLASRSFALYLVHEPVLLACSNILATTNTLVVGLVAIPLSLLAADVFCRAIEQPTHRLAKRIGGSGRA